VDLNAECGQINLAHVLTQPETKQYKKKLKHTNLVRYRLGSVIKP